MEQNTSNLFELQIDHQSNAYLRETAKWAKFMAIMGFIACAFLVLIAVFAGSVIASGFGSFSGGGMAGMGIVVSIIYIALALLLFFPNLYLFRFAGQMQTALRNNDQALLTTSFGNLKSYYKFIGILVIIMLAFWALGLVFGVLGATMASFN
jgi:hypothetical protein